ATVPEQMLDELDEKDLVQTITERQNQPLREVDLNQYL
ncbi:type II toxin-antitoxin system Phd/YefM family antitoxin, partial [Escherichia coli]